ncbi:hypothetical protein C3K47_13245 [Solitalea longa]|uniref:Uncharacterized protein n=1 Tax=Solitalea longa TaxID=2079460 RepID=A0A2S4ZZF4_9SPHI|nr:hypothetical protein [Solitalea longa]POY35720.1 hypothetical protein C3K47_13245 [Solitalea longa]
MPNFQEIFDELKTDVLDLAKLTFKNFKDDASKDVNDFLAQSEDKLKRWTNLAANNDITKDEFAVLVKGLKDGAEMKLLKQTGLAKVRIDEFKNSLINLVTDTVFKFL